MSIGANEGYPRGKLITNLPKGSWQAKELKKPGGMRFYEPIPYAERLERPPVNRQSAAHIGELTIVAAAQEEVGAEQIAHQAHAEQTVAEPELLTVAC